MIPSLSSLSWREKIGQTCQIHGREVTALEPDRLEAFFGERPVGSVFLGSEIIQSTSNRAQQLKRLINSCQRVSRVPLSIAGDLENGAGGAVRGLTEFPNLLALGAVDDERAAYDYGKWTALEARAAGFNWTFGPVVDLCFNWLNPVVNIRALGESPAKVSALGAALIRGCQEHGLSATAKHFPGDGVDWRDQHLCLSVNSLSEKEWLATYGQVYRACFDAGVHAVMAGHVALPWLERGRACGGAPLPGTTSQRILDGLLRERLGFEGVVVSDALIMAGFRGRASTRRELLVEAFNAGIDVMLWPGDDYFELMEQALNDGRITEERLNGSVERILAMKRSQEQFASPLTCGTTDEVVPNPGAVAYAHDLAARSLTLVKNNAGRLPLDADRVKRVFILLATPREVDAAKRLQPLLEALDARGIQVEWQVNGNCLDLRKREVAGERFDALLAIFESWIHGRKNTMRPTGAAAECLWTIQGLETMAPVVISLGSPYLIYEMPWADTYVNAYTSNPHTLRALAAALFDANSWPGRSPVGIDDAWNLPLGRKFLESPKSHQSVERKERENSLR
jgi:beta-N-acetylhexosaminidase